MSPKHDAVLAGALLVLCMTAAAIVAWVMP